MAPIHEAHVREEARRRDRSVPDQDREPSPETAASPGAEPPTPAAPGDGDDEDLPSSAPPPVRADPPGPEMVGGSDAEPDPDAGMLPG